MKRAWFLEPFLDRFGGLMVPLWLRRITPWWLLRRLNDRYHICWANIVSWKLGYGDSWELGRGCFHPYDYCGKYDQCSAADRMEGLRVVGESEVTICFKEQP